MYHYNDEFGMFIIYSFWYSIFAVCAYLLLFVPLSCLLLDSANLLLAFSISCFLLSISSDLSYADKKRHCFVAGHINTIHYFTAHTFKIIKNIIKLRGKEKDILYTCISTLSSWTELLSLSTSTRIAATCYRAKTFICMSKVTA